MTQQTRVRRVAALAAGALASTTLATVGIAAMSAPAQAAGTGGALAWEISQQFDDHLSTHVLGGGATEAADGVVTFPFDHGSVNPTTGAAVIEYDGSAAGSFINGGTTYYTVTFADPIVTVGDDGKGTISAVVSASNAAAMGNPAASTTPARVVVTTFALGAGWANVGSLSSLTATPAWANVLAPNSAKATELGLAADRPYDGKSWAATFLGQITSGVRPHFYDTNQASEKKAPAAFTATVPTKVVSAVATSSKQTVSVKVDGNGFTGSDGKPGDDGIYVGLAPAGGLPATATQADMDKFTAAQWLPASAIVNGAISTTLTATANMFDKGTSYAVYTWRAHGHSSTSQDTQTAVTLDWKQLSAKAKVTAKVAKKPTTKKAGKLKVAVKGGTLKASGKVVVKLKKGKVTKTKKATVKKGVATVVLPKLKPGKWKATVAYTSSDAAYSDGKKVVTVKVKK